MPITIEFREHEHPLIRGPRRLPRFTRFSPDGRWLAIIDSDGTLFVLATNDWSRRLRRDNVWMRFPLCALAWSPCSTKLVYSCDAGGNLCFLNVENGERHTLIFDGYPHCIDWSSDGARLVVGSRRCSFVVLDAATHKIIDTASLVGGDVHAVGFVPGSHDFRMVGRFNNVYHYSAKSGRTHHLIRSGEWCTAMAHTTDGIAAFHFMGTTAMAPAHTLVIAAHGHEVYSRQTIPSGCDKAVLHFSPDGRRLLRMSGWGPLGLWERLDDGTYVLRNARHQFRAHVYDLSLHPDGSRVAISSHTIENVDPQAVSVISIPA